MNASTPGRWLGSFWLWGPFFPEPSHTLNKASLAKFSSSSPALLGSSCILCPFNCGFRLQPGNPLPRLTPGSTRVGGEFHRQYLTCHAGRQKRGHKAGGTKCWGLLQASSTATVISSHHAAQSKLLSPLLRLLQRYQATSFYCGAPVDDGSGVRIRIKSTKLVRHPFRLGVFLWGLVCCGYW